MRSYRELIEEYKRKKTAIKKRLKEFKNLRKAKDERLFSELCFCILTPQSNARYCDQAIQELKEGKILFTGTSRAIQSALKGRSRFHNKKAEYIVGARRCFNKRILREKDIQKIRGNLVKNIKGIGYKEASHFLRNIGLGKRIAILDRHILKNLKKYGVIGRIPSSLTPSVYIGIEDKVRRFSEKVKIPLDELDLLFWSNETGEIFK